MAEINEQDEMVTFNVRFECEKCGVLFDDKAFLLAHDYLVHSGAKNGDHCQLCPAGDWSFKDSNEDKMLSHVALAHFEKVADDAEVDVTLVGGDLSAPVVKAVRDERRKEKLDSRLFNACSICGLLSRKTGSKRYKNHDPNMFKHYKRQHPEALSTCTECGLQFMTCEALKKHQSEAFHVSCKECGKTLWSKILFLKHEFAEHKKISGYSCLGCRQFFVYEEVFKEHSLSCGEGNHEAKKELLAMLDKLKNIAHATSTPSSVISQMRVEVKDLMDKFQK